MRRPILAANWKMHLGPEGAAAYAERFLAEYRPRDDREVWFFPSAVAIAPLVRAFRDRLDAIVGAQHVYWETKGAYTGELSVAMVGEAGARAALVGHSERRHLFGETDEDTARKVRALLAADLIPMLCIGETLEEREAGRTMDVVRRQLGVLDDLEPESLSRVVVAYEPVWAIGTGKTATPGDAAEVHTEIRGRLADRGLNPDIARILYGGSVKPDNISALMRQSEIDGVLVGGASLDPAQWAEMANAELD